MVFIIPSPFVTQLVDTIPGKLQRTLVAEVAMYNEILVPLDGSRLAEDAIPVAAALAERHGGRLHFVGVSLPVIAGLGAPLAPEYPVSPSDELDRIARDELAGYLSRWAGHIARTDQVVVRHEVLAGIDPVADQLLAYAARHSIDLVVMHTHGRGALGRMWLGSVANGLVQKSGLPCLLLRGPGDGASKLTAPVNPRRILVPLDGSTEAELAVEFAIALARPELTTIDLLSVVTPLPFPGAMLTGPSVEARTADAERYLERVAGRVRQAGIPVRPRAVIHQSPPAAIMELVAERDTDLLAIAAHFRSRANRVFLGSVIDRLLRTTRVPMLVWRSRELAGTALLPPKAESEALVAR